MQFAVRDSGKSAYLPIKNKNSTLLSVITPVYRGGVTPATVAARRNTFIGWIGMSLVPNVVLVRALEGHSNIAVKFSYSANGSHAVFTSGVAPRGAHSVMTSLHNGWTVETYGAVAGGGIFENGGATLLLLGGIALSLLMGLLIYVLGTGRARAKQLVRERTSELEHQSAELEYQALHDSLTGLPNRALIRDRIEQMLARARRDQLPCAAMFLDLDNFKDVNDTLGHKAGDDLLVAVSQRLKSAVRGVDSVGRLGGDEFVILVEGATLSEGTEALGNRILEALLPPVEVADSPVPLSISASIGIATDSGSSTSDELLRDADIALYRAKAAGKACVTTFAPAMQDAVNEQRWLGVELHRAFDEHQFFLLYQPVINLATNAFVGVEALLRWQHPERGVIQPDEFIPALEASGLIVSVGAWVLKEACRQGAIWAGQGHAISVSVNVSGKQLERNRLVDDVHDALDATGFDPVLLILELTETSMMENVDAAVERLTILKSIGVRIAIDDFGTGYSSVVYLQQFPLDILKIDRSFVSKIVDSKESAALVHTIIDLGKALNFETIAEGIEEEDQRLALLDEHVDAGQGFLFSRPIDVSAIEHLFKESVTSSHPSVEVTSAAVTQHQP
ncbi:MAG TPA: EAL domain-containing protein [Acidimicrobiales bacterium]|nr:EAL domain-containing protein [Acidimicrobiales bacterium]